MPDIHYTITDLFSALLAFGLFPLVIVFPGYVVGWLLDIFDFRQRRRLTQLVIGLSLSFAVSPIVLYLTSRLISIPFAAATTILFTLVGLIILLRSRAPIPMDAATRRWLRLAAWIGAAWVAIAILSLVDIQWGDRLFYSIVSYDQTSRVSIVEAMTRTGVPPVNPSYYPGKPVLLTFLYFYWYVPCSVVDWLGGSLVDARAALTASSAWAGLGVIALITLVLRLRNERAPEKLWRAILLGVGSLAISGLDCIPVLMLMTNLHFLPGDMEHWNTQQITAWAGSFLWVPHHVASMIAGIVAIMTTQSALDKSSGKQMGAALLAGLAFASSLGLSVWVTLVFVVFWIVWMIWVFFQTRKWRTPLLMASSGLIALLLSLPFLLDMFRGGSGGSGQFPIGFEIRTFYFSEALASTWSPLARSLLNLVFLPINYLFELGFFLVVGLLWLQARKEQRQNNPFHNLEILLLSVSFLFGTFLRSNVISNNDLGWRAWLPGQFILLIWGVDMVEYWFFAPPQTTKKKSEAPRTKIFLIALAFLGMVTTSMDLVFLRLAWPIYGETDMGNRTFAARQAYDYLRDHVPPSVVTQNNPLNEIDRPSGLYGTHQMVVSDRTAYGVPTEAFQSLTKEVGIIFAGNAATWARIDALCQRYSIQVLILKDTDPIWKNIAALRSVRSPLYANSYYALFACGTYIP